jgi:ubiquinone/menaquinone biosynthesis C-methylase UbiE
MAAVPTTTKKAYKGAPMEGMVATWYAKQTAKLSADFQADARRIAARLRPGARVLEIAPGPGYLAVEAGAFQVTGLDISQTFVQIASEYAARSGVEIEFLRGDAAAIPFPDGTFDFVVCRAAFKNFANPVGALSEMRRVLTPGGEALVIDMRNNASNEALDSAVDSMRLGPISAAVNRLIFRSLRNRAYSREDFHRMAAATAFGRVEIVEQPIGFDIWLRK